MVKEAETVRKMLKAVGFNVTLVNARFVKPLDEGCIMELAKNHKLLVTMEENVMSGGFGERVLRFVNNAGIDISVQIMAVPNQYLEQGNVDVLRRECGLDATTMAEKIEKRYKNLT
jgi:1-deoxy-D-xylulose-5-phosphate synthase